LEKWADRATAARLSELLIEQFIASFKVVLPMGVPWMRGCARRRPCASAALAHGPHRSTGTRLAATRSGAIGSLPATHCTAGARWMKEELAMLHRIKELVGDAIAATDGPLGQVDEIYLDERWSVRYSVPDTGWLVRTSAAGSDVTRGAI
jgi:hypothetical protein